jgi:hypothetical protein
VSEHDDIDDVSDEQLDEESKLGEQESKLDDEESKLGEQESTLDVGMPTLGIALSNPGVANIGVEDESSLDVDAAPPRWVVADPAPKRRTKRKTPTATTKSVKKPGMRSR